MSKKRRANRHDTGKRRPGHRRPARRRRTDEPDLLQAVAAALADGHPLALLGIISSLMAALQPQRQGPFEPASDPDVPSLDELVQTFLDVELPETSALLLGIAELAGDDMMRRRVRREVTGRAHVLPAWLVDLRQAEVEGVAEMVHVLGDGDDVMVGVRLPDGGSMSIVVYIDHNMGTLVKDAFIVPEPLDEWIQDMRAASGDDPDTSWAALDPAEARARLEAAIELGAITFPPFESDTWPACQPLVEWVAGLLPDGGTGYQRPVWEDDALADLTDRFLRSPFGADLDDADHRSLLESLLWFGTDYGPGDPLRWSPVAVELLLADWIPRKIVADAAFLAKAPDLLRAFIRFCHHERGIRAALTADTLAAVDAYEPDYQRTIRSPRPQGPLALLAAMGALDPDGPWPSIDGEPADLSEIMLDGLRRAVGGDAAMDALDAAPLPDEGFDWAAIPVDVHDRVAAVLALVDGCCADLLDQEYRTGCRRFLARAAAGDPQIFRRRGKTETAAAAVCWVIGKANDRFIAGDLPAKDLLAHFGVQGSVSQRSAPLLRAIHVDPDQYGAMNLSSPDYLTSARRQQILLLRDRYRSPADG